MSRVAFRTRLGVGAGLFLVTVGIRLVPAGLLRTEIGDMGVYKQVAASVRNGDNVYAYPITFPYAPYSQFLPAAVGVVAEKTGLPFRFVLKSLVALADGGTTLLVFAYLLRRTVPLQVSVSWALAWALNPVSVLVSAFHGNVMPIAPFLAMAAFLAAEFSETGPNRDLLLPVSALLLGLAIAMRTYPVLLLPIFLMLFARSASELAVFTGLAALPAALSSLPYLIFARETFLREVLGYSGVPDFGWFSVLRAPAYLLRGQDLHAEPGLMAGTKQLFLGAAFLACLTLPFFRRSSFARALLIVPLLFYAFYGGVSAQYLVWILPFAACCRDRFLLPFTAAATAAMIPFYSIYHPGVLTGGLHSPIRGDQPAVWVIYASANAMLVIVSLTWAALIVVAELRSYRSAPRLAPVPWLQNLRGFWSSRGYTAALLAASAGWLLLAWLTLRRANGLVRAILG